MNQVIYAVGLAFALTVLTGKLLLPVLKRLKIGQNIREDGPQSHLKKAGTPTMGGVFFIIPIIIVVFLFNEGNYDFAIASVLSMMGFGLIGFIDDYTKLVMKRSLGLRGYQKMIGQIGLAAILAFYAYTNPNIGSGIYVPFTNFEWDLGVLYIPIMIFIIVGTVNSVNLTDGLDGLASGVTLVVSAALCAVAAAAAMAANNEGLVYLGINYKNIAIIVASVAGGCMGFLRYNTHPARVFMGDTGSMALGGIISAVSILLRIPLFLPFFGGIYMIESGSVIIQVISYKTRGKRVFKMSPIHHHYELKGMPETQVVTMFMITAAILCLIGLLGV